MPESAPPSRPPPGAAAHDLTEAEFAELDGLLAGIPEPLEPLDVVMLDGFLAGVVVQPLLLDVEQWLPYVFDSGGHRWGEAEPSPEQRRARELIVRRLAAINRSLAEYRAFEPLILEPGDGSDEAADSQGEEAAEPGGGATIDVDSGDGAASPAAEAQDPAADPVTVAILPWVAGFQFAADLFPGLDEVPDDGVATALARLYRFLPAEEDDDRATVELVRRERPLASIDAAVDEVVACVADLYDLTEPLRYRVETVRRAEPKVGRNDPCPCGSGRKFKQCHGAG
ncbi:MAG TPA: UPF0149 family protein [Caldimonas sp.]|nr:UPF0149 family protein [Caldimonas sp.]